MYGGGGKQLTVEYAANVRVATLTISTSQVLLDAKIDRQASNTAVKMLMSAHAAAAISGVRKQNLVSLLAGRRMAFFEAAPMRAISMPTRSTF